MFRSLSRVFLLLSGIAALCSSPFQAKAQLTLTAGAVTAGFGLTTFATGFPTDGAVGPLGITFTASGGVLVADYPGNLRLFATDVDGQIASAAINVTNYGSHNALGLATTGGSHYMAQQSAGRILQVNPDTSFNHVVLGGLNGSVGLVTNPLNGHLLASINGSAKIIDLNPVTGVATDVITGLSDVDGISLSADGTVVYAAVRGNGRLQGYNLASHALVFDTPVPNLDGTVAGTGLLAGNIFANTTDGHLLEIDLTTGIQTLIATGGSRGDFVAADPNGTLLVTQTDRVLRLTAPSGGGFGNNVPEPGSMALMAGLSLSASLFFARRRKQSHQWKM